MAVSNRPWGSFSESDYADADAFCRAALIDTNDPGSPKSKAKCKLPIREPGGALNRNGVHAAAARLNQVDAPAADKAKAARKLVAAYRECGEDPPAVVTRMAGTAKAASYRQGPVTLGDVMDAVAALPGHPIAATMADDPAPTQPQWAQQNDDTQVGVGDMAPTTSLPSPTLKVPFFRLGEWVHPTYGTITASEATLNAMLVNFRNQVLGRPPYLRIGHDQDGKATFGDTQAAGWVTDLRREGDVLYALVEPTSPDIVQAVQTRRLRYASAEWEPSYMSKTDGRDLGPTLLAIGLTNEPFLTNLPDSTVLLADRAQTPTFVLDYALPLAGTRKERSMDLDVAERQTTLLERILERLSGGSQPAAPQGADPEPVKLADSPETTQKLAEMERRLAAETAARQQTERRLHAQRVEADLTARVSQGIPPVVLERLRPLLLSAHEGQVIKLADGQDVSTYAALLGIVDATPPEQRISFAHVGSVDAPRKPGDGESDPALVQERARKLAETYVGNAAARMVNGTH